MVTSGQRTGSKLTWRDRQGLPQWWSIYTDLGDVYAKGEIVLEMMTKRRPLWGKEKEEYGSVGQLWGVAAWPAACS